jgi:hypothetical protein
MGTGEWSTMATRIQSAEKADDEPQCALGQANDGFSRFIGNESEIDAYLEVTLQLGGGTEGYAQASDELRSGPQGVALNHVGGNGRRGSTDLISEAEVTAERLPQRQGIRGTGQPLSTLPRFQSFELLHACRMRPGSGERVTRRLRHGAHSPRARVPIPQSPSFHD